MSDETTGEFKTPQQAPAIAVNARTILLLVALLSGGVVGGGGISIATGPSKEDFAALKASVETVAVAMVEIKADLAADRRFANGRDKTLDDHEKRIRKLEEAD